ncbi:glutathione synthetase ATP-binding domain-like protein, partial [Caulochytrium protostelioides]
LMRVVEQARHLEIQVVADQHGDVITLFSRDCTLQRRHQKIIEQAPAVIAPPHVLRAMEAAAYLYDPATTQFYFLEANPRLQVEHPTTEMITEVNLPAVQLMIAMGIPLGQMQDVCTLY